MDCVSVYGLSRSSENEIQCDIAAFDNFVYQKKDNTRRITSYREDWYICRILFLCELVSPYHCHNFSNNFSDMSWSVGRDYTSVLRHNNEMLPARIDAT